MVGQEEASHSTTCVSPVQRPGWKPSRFFDEWKEKVASTKGRGLVGYYIEYYRDMSASIRKTGIEQIMRTTLSLAYVSDDRDEATDAMYNDADAIREYAARFFDEFWDDHWRPYLVKCFSGAENLPRPPGA